MTEPPIPDALGQAVDEMGHDQDAIDKVYSDWMNEVGTNAVRVARPGHQNNMFNMVAFADKTRRVQVKAGTATGMITQHSLLNADADSIRFDVGIHSWNALEFVRRGFSEQLQLPDAVELRQMLKWVMVWNFDEGRWMPINTVRMIARMAFAPEPMPPNLVGLPDTPPKTDAKPRRATAKRGTKRPGQPGPVADPESGEPSVAKVARMGDAQAPDGMPTLATLLIHARRDSQELVAKHEEELTQLLGSILVQYIDITHTH